jgi:site-specific DNA recombinase
MSRRSTTLQPAPQTRAALYIRVSTEDQALGYGLDVQRHCCSAMATVKGWQVIGEYADEGISGTKNADQRPALARLLANVDAGLIDAVIVLALDRLGRRTQIVLELVEWFTAARVSLVCCKEQIDTAGPYGELMLTIFAALAQLERDLIVERITAGRNVRGAKDGERDGQLPYGYTRTDEGPQID